MAIRRILIVGGSTRAAADSVRRADCVPVCADFFADLDLRANAEVIPVRSYPESLPDDIATVNADGWFYTGAMENRPDILQRIVEQKSNIGLLLGTSPEALYRIRDPQWLANHLRKAGIPALDVISSLSPPVPDGSWLQKPLASAGGRLIRVWDRAAERVPFEEPHYFQRRVTGTGLSAIFRIESSEIEWLGATRELETDAGSHPPTEFSYCGSCGPLNRISFGQSSTVASRDRFRIFSGGSQSLRKDRRIVINGCAVFSSRLQRLLNAIAVSLVSSVPGLHGLIGLDFRFDGKDIWLTEINPRYTASVEILEYTQGRSLLNLNPPESCMRTTITSQRSDSPVKDCLKSHSTARVFIKQILYAHSRIEAPNLSSLIVHSDPWRLPQIADIPTPGAVFEMGWPICTVLASGATSDDARANLRRQIQIIQSTLYGP